MCTKTSNGNEFTVSTAVNRPNDDKVMRSLDELSAFGDAIALQLEIRYKAYQTKNSRKAIVQRGARS